MGVGLNFEFLGGLFDCYHSGIQFGYIDLQLCDLRLHGSEFPVNVNPAQHRYGEERHQNGCYPDNPTKLDSVQDLPLA